MTNINVNISTATRIQIHDFRAIIDDEIRALAPCFTELRSENPYFIIGNTDSEAVAQATITALRRIS